MIKISGPSYGPISKQKPKQAIIFLHGVGADGNDLISLANEFADSFPDAVFLSPNAPFPYDMAPMGFQWFSLQERSLDALMEGAENVRPILDHYIDEVKNQYGLEDKEVAIISFSQGTMTALYTLLRREKPLAGLLGYSGAMLDQEENIGKFKSKPPICLIHGEMDPVVPFGALNDAHGKLKKAGVDVEAHGRPGVGHGIDPKGIKLGLEFLKKNL